LSNPVIILASKGLNNFDPKMESPCMKQELLESHRQRCEKWRPWWNRKDCAFRLYGHPGMLDIKLLL